MTPTEAIDVTIRRNNFNLKIIKAHPNYFKALKCNVYLISCLTKIDRWIGILIA
jgi:hypothetical protein